MDMIFEYININRYYIACNMFSHTDWWYWWTCISQNHFYIYLSQVDTHVITLTDCLLVGIPAWL